MSTARAGRRPRPQQPDPAGPSLWGAGLCGGDCPGPRDTTAVIVCTEPGTGRQVSLCARCLWRQIAAHLNRRHPPRHVWDVTVCEDHPPETMPTLPHRGRRLCPDCLPQAQEPGAPPIPSLTRWPPLGPV